MKNAKAILALFVFSIVAFVPTYSQQQTGAQSAVKRADYLAEMRDGVKLATTVFLPEGDGPFPVVLIRTPYGKDTQSGGNAMWTKRGFALAVQDCRGRFKSEGTYRPFLDDEQDGYDTVEWIAKQAWSNGKIGMFGASAMGITANLAAMTNPPHLTAIFVLVARSSIYHQSAYNGGVFRKELNEIWLRRQGALDVLEETFKHNVYDGFYDVQEMSKHWSRIHVPAYNYGGWYDIFSQGNVSNFVGLQKYGSDKARGNQRLMMGPWGHGNIEEVKYPANSVINVSEEAARWFDHWLRGVDNGISKEPAVKYYVMGDVTDSKAPGNEWRTATVWPVPSKITPYYLLAGGGLSQKMASDKTSLSSYVYDPKNPVPTIGGSNLNIKKGPMDQRAIGDRKDVLKFSTPALVEPVEVTGQVEVELWGGSDAPDTDFMVKLIDVYPDGTERLVLDSAVRARFREGFNREVFMQKGKAYKFKLDLWCTSIIFNKGHRIAAHVSSSNDPRYDPNPNTGKPMRADSETRVATNTIYHDRTRPSRILLPVVPMMGGHNPAPAQR